MKILLLNSGTDHQAVLFASAFSKKVERVNIINLSLTESSYIYREEIEKLKHSFYLKTGSSRLRFKDIEEFDVIFGINQNVLPALSEIKNQLPHKIYGCQILDYPIHVFKNNKDYLEGYGKIWYLYKQCLRDLDVVAYNQKNSSAFLDFYLSEKCVRGVVLFPIDITLPSTSEREDFIVYSGRLCTDKGVNYILDSLSLLEKKPKLVTIGSGYDFSDYAKFLKVDYEQMKNLSEQEKWDIYYKSRFLICGADNPYIPTLCILEGVAIGRTGIVWDFEENRFHYGDNVSYVEPLNILKLSEKIDSLYRNLAAADQIAINGPDYVAKNCTYEVWANRVIDLLHDKIEKDGDR